MVIVISQNLHFLTILLTRWRKELNYLRDETVHLFTLRRCCAWAELESSSADQRYTACLTRTKRLIAFDRTRRVGVSRWTRSLDRRVDTMLDIARWLARGFTDHCRRGALSCLVGLFLIRGVQSTEWKPAVETGQFKTHYREHGV